MLRILSQNSLRCRGLSTYTRYANAACSVLHSKRTNFPVVQLIPHRNARTQVRRIEKPDESFKLAFKARQDALSDLAKSGGWFNNPNRKPILPGWSCDWSEWLAGWELLPICTRSETELTLEHFYGLTGSITPVIFQLNKERPDFMFRHNDSGHFYYYRMEDDDIFQFDEKYDGSLEEFSDKTVEDIHTMMGSLRVVDELPDAHKEWVTAFEEQLVLLELELGGDPYPLTVEKMQEMRMRYSLLGGIAGYSDQES